MYSKNREVLLTLLHDADEYATFKKIDCPPIYLLGGSGCILGDYLDRATLDIDFIDINYSSTVGKVFRLFDRFDMLDTYVTPIADGYEQRAKLLEGFTTLRYYVLSAEDIIVSKLGRYSVKDQDDINHLIEKSDIEIISSLIANVISRKDFSERVKQAFVMNSRLFREKYNV
ncbi:hypothetical protein KHM83_19455 [Fusibacter paucivorans]|uniref:DUF6036 domain-containing protein n=1 Tax=Fusibacter paucivorans TaxID=76009 RepID=A0ABS5PUK4_9FIRM|nr:DUF6036 family nucleotidyltransferase [Fusibacter paucivorans]MBS7528848.1 hypothetical protein [Fusibacter paucivorans]